jgi:hypothetical protein
VIKPRETITSGTEWSRVVRLSPDADITDVDLSIWSPASFITESYKQWWQEWREQLFATSVHAYRHTFSCQVDDPVPSMSKSGKPFDLRPVSPISLIGYNALTLATLLHQRTRAKTITSKSKLATARATPLAAASTLIKAFKVITLFISTHADHKLY